VKTHSSFRQLNLSSRSYRKPLPELAKWYLRDLLQIPEELKNIASICAKVCKFFPDLTIKGQYTKILESKLDSADFQVCRDLIEQHLSAQTRHAANQAVAPTSTDSGLLPFAFFQPPTPGEEAEEDVNDNPIQPPPAKKQKPADDIMVFDREYQKEFGVRPDKAGKIRILIGATNDVMTQVREGKKLPDIPGRRWFYRAASVAMCVNECHSDSVDAFLLRNVGFNISRFQCSNGCKHKSILA